MSAQKTRSTHGFILLPEADSVPPLRVLARAPLVVRYAAAIFTTAVATIVAIAIDSRVTIPNLSLIFVLPVITCAVTFGLGPSLCAAVLGALAYNFFLTEPRYSLAVDDPANIWAIGLLFVVGCVASAVASTARRRADDAALLGDQAKALQLYGNNATKAGNVRIVASTTASTLEELFHVPVTVMLLSGTAIELAELRGAIKPVEIEMEAARSSLSTHEAVHAGVYPYDASRFDFWPITTPAGKQAVIGVAFDPDRRPSNANILVEIIKNILALTLDRQNLDATGSRGQ
jgi:two-component system sensor histidine kinase KdpD